MRELDYVYATLQRLGARPREIEDLAEEVFTTFQRDWPGREQDRPLRAFLFAVAFRIVSAHRHQETTPRVAVREEPPVGPHEGSPPGVHLLMKGLEALALPQRAVLVMHELDGFSIGEIAACLSLTQVQASSRLREARQELTSAVDRLPTNGTGP